MRSTLRVFKCCGAIGRIVRDATKNPMQALLTLDCRYLRRLRLTVLVRPAYDIAGLNAPFTALSLARIDVVPPSRGLRERREPLDTYAGRTGDVGRVTTRGVP